MATLTPYIISNNSKAESIPFYQKLFEAKLLIHMPATREYLPSVPADFDFSTTTAHAELDIYGAKIAVYDNFGRFNLANSPQVSISITPDSVDQMQGIYNRAVELKCTIVVPLSKQPWGAYLAVFTDPFGVHWLINM